MKTATPAGFRDLLPDAASKKERIVDRILSVYRRFGFVPLETPVVEFQETLVDEQTDFNLFNVSSSRDRQKGEAEPLAMRFDLTVPLSRVVAQYPELPKPFKRYQLGNVFRGERPQKGRFRQFAQLDADIVGSDSIFADIEMIAMMREVMLALGITNFLVRVNTRKILNALPIYAAFPDADLRKVLIVLDKRDKITQEELREMLVSNEGENPGLSESSAQKLITFGNIAGEPSKVVAELRALMGDSEAAQEGLEQLATIAETLSRTSLGTDKIVFDMSIIRGLAYYTGPVFETILTDAPELGSVYSGGRYDELIGKFLGDKQSIPAVGASVGVDRLIAALDELAQREGVDSPQTVARSYVVLVQSDEVLSYAFQVASLLRSQGITCDLYTGREKNLGKQFGYAEGKGYQFAIIVGSTEVANETVQLKNLLTREQEEVSLAQLLG